MANHLDLEEQEQLDQLKHFWKQYGNAITWALIAILSAFAAWNFYNYWQRSQANQAAALFDEVERSIQSGDTAKIDRVFSDMKERFASTTYAQQSGLLAAKHYAMSGKPDAAKAALVGLAKHPSETGSGVTVTRFWKQGNVDYKKVPELAGVELDAYRGKAREEVRVSVK